MRRMLLLALFVVLIPGLSLACGGGDDDPTATPGGAVATQPSESSASAPTATAAEDQQDADDDASSFATRAPLEVGSSAEVRSEEPYPEDTSSVAEGRVKVTITDILDDPDPGDEAEVHDEGNKFWAIKVRLEATGDEVVNTGSWSIRLDDGMELPSTYALDAFGLELTYDAIEPGDSVEGIIAFEIPRDVEVAEVVGHMSLFADGVIIFEAR